MDKTDEEMHEAQKSRYISDGHIKYHIARLGDEIAKEKGYKDLKGLEAIHRYLIDKYKWLPYQVRSLTIDELQLLLDGEFEKYKS